MGLLQILFGVKPISPAAAHFYHKWFKRSYAILGFVGWTFVAYYAAFDENSSFTWEEMIWGDRERMIVRKASPVFKVYEPGKGFQTVYRADVVKAYEDKKIKELQKISI